MDINRAFPYKVCINLDRRTDRWEQMRARFERHNIYAVRRFSAVDGQGSTTPDNWSSTSGAYGCLLSHLRVVQEARKQGESSVLIFEDDVVFDAQFSTNFNAYIKQLPRDWAMLYFGALHQDDLLEVSENIHRVRRACSTYAYALNYTIFDAFIELNSRADLPVDVTNHELQQQHACYCFMPHLAWVDSEASDVQERHKHHWYLQESLVIRGGSMDRLQDDTTLIIAYRNPTDNEHMTRNVLFLARYHFERLHGMSIVIVEQGMTSTIDPAALPDGCQYSFLESDGPFNRGRCFNIGMKLSDPTDTFLIFSDSDIFMEEWDICGNLRACQRYDGTTGFRSLIELTGTDTLKLQANRAMLTPWFNATQYTRRRKYESGSQYCFFSRESIEAVGGWDEQLSAGADLPLSVNGMRQLRMFVSPNDALRLYHD